MAQDKIGLMSRRSGRDRKEGKERCGLVHNCIIYLCSLDVGSIGIMQRYKEKDHLFG